MFVIKAESCSHVWKICKPMIRMTNDKEEQGHITPLGVVWRIWFTLSPGPYGIFTPLKTFIQTFC